MTAYPASGKLVNITDNPLASARSQGIILCIFSAIGTCVGKYDKKSSGSDEKIMKIP